MKHHNRGTWFSNIWMQLHELDGFIMRQDQSHKKVKKMATIRENSISDHRSKTIMIKTNKKAWRYAGRGESVGRINWKNITENGIFRESVNQEIHTIKDKKKKNVTNWDWIANILSSVAEEQWCLEENNTKPWFNGRDNFFLKRHVHQVVNNRSLSYIISKENRWKIVIAQSMSPMNHFVYQWVSGVTVFNHL